MQAAAPATHAGAKRLHTLARHVQLLGPAPVSKASNIATARGFSAMSAQGGPYIRHTYDAFQNSLEGKVLVANRGEIAIRISKAAKELGLKSLAVYAPQDKDSPHLSMADEAIQLPFDHASATAPYLNIGALVDI